MNTDFHQEIERNLQVHMSRICTYSEFAEVLDYGVLPAGKLFRPKLAIASFLDSIANKFEKQSFLDRNQDIALIASALEIHHAYTLVHDDLPCMDDDDFRRGRESTHKKFGQWQAVLAGDALLHYSHKLIGECKGSNHYDLRAIFNWALGAKGLILGQVFDLSGLINSSFENLLRTHELKTGRLIQTSILAGRWAAKASQGERLTLSDIKKEMRLGSNIGIVFQLLDDLSELTEELSEHEREVNPFLRFPFESISALEKGLNEIKTGNGHYLSLVLAAYFTKMKAIISKDLSLQNSLIANQLKAKEVVSPIEELMIKL